MHGQPEACHQLSAALSRRQLRKEGISGRQYGHAAVIRLFQAPQCSLSVTETERDHSALDGRDDRRERSAGESVENGLGVGTPSGSGVRVPKTPFEPRDTAGDTHGLAERLYRQLKLADLRV